MLAIDEGMADCVRRACLRVIALLRVPPDFTSGPISG